MSVTPTADDDIFKARREHRSILALARSIRSADNDTKGNDMVAAVATYQDDPDSDKGKNNHIYVGGQGNTREEWIPANRIVVPEEYQRVYSETWASEIAKKFDLRLMTKVHVNRRKDGTLVVIDGQHRLAALRKKYGADSDIRVLCEVHNLATIKDEAMLFLAMNKYVRQVDSKGTFKAELKAEVEEAIALEAIAAQFGYRMHVGGGRVARGELPVSPIMTVKRLHDRLTWNLVTELISVVRDVYGQDTDSVPSGVIMAVGSFINAYRDHPLYDRDRLIRILRGEGPNKLLRDMKDVQAALRASHQTAGRKVLLHHYNWKLTTRRLPEVG